MKPVLEGRTFNSTGAGAVPTDEQSQSFKQSTIIWAVGMYVFGFHGRYLVNLTSIYRSGTVSSVGSGS